MILTWLWRLFGDGNATPAVPPVRRAVLQPSRSMLLAPSRFGQLVALCRQSVHQPHHRAVAAAPSPGATLQPHHRTAVIP
jgi:hypothetical protein